MSFLSLATARETLWKYGSSVPYAGRSAADTAAVTSVINQTVQRFLTDVNYRGSFATARLRVFDEQITLPSPLDGIRSLRIVNSDGTLGRQFEVFSQQVNFAPGTCYVGWDNSWDTGVWSGTPGAGLGYGGIRDLGDGFPTFRDGAGEYYIRCKSTLTETPSTILLRGLDENGAQVYMANGTEGVELAVTTATTTTTQKFTEFASWVRSAATLGVIQLYAVDTTTGVEELLVNITPQKLTSGYRRYSAKGIAFGATVEALCNIAFIPAVNDNDPIVPSHLGALKLGMMALQYEDKNDLENAEIYMQRALMLLDQDRDKFDGDEVSNVVFAGFGATGSERYLIG